MWELGLITNLQLQWWDNTAHNDDKAIQVLLKTKCAYNLCLDKSKRKKISMHIYPKWDGLSVSTPLYALLLWLQPLWTSNSLPWQVSVRKACREQSKGGQSLSSSKQKTKTQEHLCLDNSKNDPTEKMKIGWKSKTQIKIILDNICALVANINLLALISVLWLRMG